MPLSLLPWLLLTPRAGAGGAWLVNDGFEAGDQVACEAGFVQDECWASVYVPAPGDYPFDLAAVEMLVASDDPGDNGYQLIHTIEFYSLEGTDMSSAVPIGSEGVALQGAPDAYNFVDVPSLELDLPQVDSGNVAVAVCLFEHSGPPAICRDTDGLDHSDRNWIYASDGRWYRSGSLGVKGDWIMRLCVQGANVSGADCSPGDDDIQTDTGGAGDTGGAAGALAVESITPSHAALGEAVDVVIIGSGFSQGAEVLIGGLDVSGVEVVGPETVQGRSPSALPVGLHDVEVKLTDGESAVLPEAFEVTGTGCGCASGRARGPAGAWPALLALLAVVCRGGYRRSREL